MNNNHITKTAKALLEKHKEYGQSSKTSSSSRSQIRIPTQRPAVQASLKKERATQHVTKEWSPEASHTDQISSHFSPETKTARSLESKQIQPFSLKKTKKALQKMREFHEKSDRKVSGKIAVLKQASSQQKKQNDQDELWRDMMKPHEERHFQIGRITNFFS